MIRIIWLGHSMFQLAPSTGEVYVLDPWIEGNPSYPAGHVFDRVDAVLVSHGHGDHLPGAAGLSQRFDAPVLAIYEVCEYLKGQGVATIAPMNKGGSRLAGPSR